MNTDTDTIVHIVGLLVIIAFVAPFVVTGMPAVVGADQSYVVTSGSMAAEPEPVIQPGDVVIVNSVDSASIQQGDIITYTTGNEQPTTHRVVAVEQEDGQRSFITKGDNNEDADPAPVQPDQVVGRVMITIPLVGHVVMFANTTLGFILLVGLPIGLLVASEIWSLVREQDGTPADDEPLPPEPRPETEPESEPAAAVASTEAAQTVAIGQRELGILALILAPITALTGVAAFRLQTALTFTLFYLSLALCLVCGLLYLRMSDVALFDDDDDDESGVGQPPSDSPATGQHQASLATSTAGGVAGPAAVGAGSSTGSTGSGSSTLIVIGQIADDFEESDRVRVDVDSLDPLTDLARERGTRVIGDTDDGAYYLVGDQTVFRYVPDEEDENVPTVGTGLDGTTDGDAEPDPAVESAVTDVDESATATDGGAAISPELRSDGELEPAVTEVEATDQTTNAERDHT